MIHVRVENTGTGEALPVNVVAGGAGDGSILDGVDTGIKATVKDLANSNPVTVAIVDGSGDQITSFGGGTQYTEDAAAAANPTGTVPILVRADTPAATVTTDGDNIAQRGTNYGAAYVTLLDTGGSPVSVGGGTQYTESATDASITGTAMLMEGAADTLLPVQGTVADGLLVNLGTNNDVTVASISAGDNNIGNVDIVTVPAPLSTTGGGTEATALRVTIASDSTGVVSVDDNGGSLTVDGTVAATQSGSWIISANSGVDIGDVTINNAAGASAVNIQDGGNSITVDGTVAVSGTVTVDTELPTAAAITDNFANPTTSSIMGMNMLWDGATWDRALGNATDGALVNLGANNDVTVTGTVTANLAAGTNNIGDVDILSIAAGDNNIGNVDIVTMPNVTLAAGTNTNEVVGDVADGATAAGNPLGIGLIGRTANRTAVTDGQAVRAAGDDIGRTLICVGQVRDLVNHQHTQIASSSAETTIVTATGASTFADLTQLVITNQTATAVNVTIKDATAGTTRMIIALAASGGAVIPFHRPVKQASANNNWTATLSSAAVTVNIFAQFEVNV